MLITYIGGQVKEGNPSSATLTSTGLLGLCCLYVVLFLYRRKFDYFLTLPTVMVDGVLYRFKLRSSESTITGSKPPKSSHYVDLLEYPPGTGNDNSMV
ncbi:hypothetical protein Hanom_Chr07g00658091 [Helianthus anomalus]